MLIFWTTSVSAEAHLESGEEIRVAQRWCLIPEAPAGQACKVVVNFLYYPLDLGDLHAKINDTRGDSHRANLELFPTD